MAVQYYLRFKNDKTKTLWKVREAKSLKAAINCINHARVSGSVGDRTVVHNYNNQLKLESVVVLGDVHRLNPDYTEVQPS